MKKLIVLGLIAIMMMGLAAAANAWVIAAVATTNASAAVQWHDGSDVKSPVSNSGATNLNWVQGKYLSSYYAGVGLKTGSFNPNTNPIQWGAFSELGLTSFTVKIYVSQLTQGAGSNSAPLAAPSLWDLYVNGTRVQQNISLTATSSASNPWITQIVNVEGKTEADQALISLVQVPEPGSILALGSGLLGLAGFAIRRRK